MKEDYFKYIFPKKKKKLERRTKQKKLTHKYNKRVSTDNVQISK